ncbi:Hybrid PKS-NRPS synthetase lepA [Dissostichus eleginoides]|uniref:Hybrid PKS-NRPS synthetase lepA n=1 Tax=Dissostichus eleginoides TaxID=100907 RepID=A0AAD9BKT1_DISEL|nr:Hybrid PKS-NRPS synthetase lepA [Dissostichus eleginoides]
MVPDVSVRRHDGEGLVTEVCSEPLLSMLHCEARYHIWFYSKQSGAGTAGSLSLLLKAFWGLLRDGPEGVIYPVFAEWTRIECDVYGHGIPISHPCQDTYTGGLMNLGCLPQHDETVLHILH